ncbi:class I SAM-dependent methyltransferase [Desulfobaculum senezii]
MTLKENDIRPDALMEDFHASVAEDVAWLSARSASFVEVPCPACAADDARPLYAKQGMRWGRCANCGTVYVSPRPTPEVLSAFYARSASYRFQNDRLFPASEKARRERLFAPRARRLDALCMRFGLGEGLRLVEVGPGFGLFLEEARSMPRFAAVSAVEATPWLAETCRERGFTVCEASVEQVDLGADAADVVVSFECVEHLFSVEGFVRACARVLRPGGLLVLTCPNAEGFDLVHLGEASNTVNHQHLNLFTTTSLPALVTACGLTVEEVATPGELDAELVRKAARAGEVDLSGQPFLRRVLLDEWDALGGSFQHFLAENGLSSHMWVVARRPVEAL